MLRINGIHSDELGKGSEESEQNRKLQRSVAELVRRIDNLHQSANRVEDVFSEDLMGLRVRLREFVLKLLHADPEKYGLKYLEIVWRKAWHEPVTLARQVLGGSSAGSVRLESHLMAGLGQFQHLLLGLAEQYGWPPALNLDIVSRQEYGFCCGKEKKYTGDKWMVDVVARCLVWLGDLSRYRLEFCEQSAKQNSEILAKKYYSACARLKPGLGLAYSQLAAISKDSNAGIDPLFFYLRCVVSRETFDGGDSNLCRLLDKSEKEVNNLMDKPPASVASVYMLQLVAHLLEDRKEDDIILACQQSLASVHQAVSVATNGQQQLQQPVEPAWLARLTACMVLVVVRLGSSSGAVARVGLCHAWLLALTSHLAGLVVNSLGKGLWGEDWTEASVNTEDVRICEDGEKKEDKSSVEPERAEKKKRKKLSDMLRRRRISNSGSSDDSDLSEDDEPLTNSDDDGSNTSDSASNSDDDLYFSDTDDEYFSDDDDDIVIESVDVDRPDSRKVVEVLESLGLLPALHVCLVWLQAQPQVLAGMGEGGEQLWTKLARLFTLLNLDSDNYSRNDRIHRLKTKNATTPVEEEFYLRDLDLFVEQLNGCEWSRNPAGGSLGETAARLGRLEAWRDWLVARTECPVRWREVDGGRAVLVQPARQEKKSVMKHMAELWLKEEVNNLEKNRSDMCCVFVVDAPALTVDLNMVRRVAGYKKFTMIVPQVVVRELDNDKKHVRGARQSIRWLERELSRGHKGLQPQDDDEKVKLDVMVPHRKDPGWARHSVLQCVAYFAAQQEIILLTGDEEIIERRDPDANKVLSELNVRVEPISNFMERYLGLTDLPRERRRSGNDGRRQQRRRWRRDNNGGRGRRDRSRGREEGGG